MRLGFAVADKKITRALQAVKSPYNVNSLSQEIGTVIYKHKELLNERSSEIIKNTKSLYEALVKIKEQYDMPVEIFKPCTNFVFIKTDFAKKLYEYLLDNGIAVRFFKPNALRITAGSESENSELMKYIEKYILEKYVYMNV